MNLPTDPISTLSTWHAALVAGPAFVCALAAAVAGPSVSVAAAWRFARWGATAALALAAASLVAVLLGSQGTGLGLRADAVGGVVMLLVAFIAWVIVRYSQRYLNGERDERHYVRWLMATLATVGLVVASNHLLVLVLAWTATSLTLHRLLTFFNQRPAAVVAAHKKFIVARLADACMLLACLLLLLAFGTLHIDALAAHAAADAALPWSAQAATLLIVLAAVLKCALLPFHGWLIQVMEAPTPVSALLHAGVVNLGGFVLMRMAPLVSETPAAQVLLVAAGTATAVLAALVMTTRISIKVMLAWSTCAQMGFMLMQCGLGAWDMALLHLVAHSLYKAHAFLGAGGAVRRATLAQLLPTAAPTPPNRQLMGGVVGVRVGVGMTVAAAATVGWLVPGLSLTPVVLVLAGIVALALVSLVQAQAWQLGRLWLPALGLGAFGVALAYFTLHVLLTAWLPPAAAPPATVLTTALWLGVALAFVGLFMLQSLISLAPQGALARRLYPWFYGGLFLDEAFSRRSFALWPPPAPSTPAALLPVSDTALATSAPNRPAGAST